MKRTLAAITLTLLLLTSALAAQTDRQDVGTSSPSFVLHIDFQKLQESETGANLIGAFWKLPYVSTQLNTLPPSLDFIRQVGLTSATIYLDSTRDGATPILEVRAAFDDTRLTELLEHARGYAKVQYGGHDIHHWVTNFEQFGGQLIGQGAPVEDMKESSDSVYLSIPERGRVVISTSLADLVGALDRNLTVANLLDTSRFAKQFGDGENLIVYQVTGVDDAFPGDLVAVFREATDGKMVLRTAVKTRNAQERTQAAMVNQMLNNPDSAAQMFGITMAQAEGARSDSELELSATQAKPEKKGSNEVSIGLKMDSIDLGSENISTFVNHILDHCVQCDYQDDILSLDVGLYLAPCEVVSTPINSTRGQAAKLTRNRLDVRFNAYSTKENLERAKLASLEKEGSKADTADSDVDKEIRR